MGLEAIIDVNIFY